MKSLTTLLQPDFSEVGSNKGKFENQVYSAFLKYLRSVASKNLIVDFYYFKQKTQKQCSKIVFVCNLSIHVPKMNDKCIDFHLGGHRSGISLNNILQFATCDEEVPLLGYENGVKPSATFHEVAENKSFIYQRQIHAAADYCYQHHLLRLLYQIRKLCFNCTIWLF